MEFFNSLWPQLESAARAMTWLEIAGVVFNLAAVLLTIRASVLNFPVGIVACALFFALFWQYKLYADAVLQIFFLALVLYGWWNWAAQGAQVANISSIDKDKPPIPEPRATALHELKATQEDTLPIQNAPLRWLVGGVIGAAVFGIVWGLGLRRFTDASLPYWDAQIAAFSILAQYFVARKWVQNWLIWIAVDIVSTAVFWHKDLKLTAVLYAFFTLLAIVGYAEWRHKSLNLAR